VHTAVGGDVEVTDDGRLVIPGTSFLAGASDTLAHGVARLASLPSFSLAQALRLATRNPARVVGDTSDAALRPGTRNVMTFRWRPGDASLKDVQLVEG
ncbi:MAG TPA: N-acetylglucosamine-6-phosphate deacetylase, partial [Microbacteriaceae bacterium]|nr:N-acetylglucosamine-6-phosphate deacetylase [Microbacteriaceae bacterium]